MAKHAQSLAVLLIPVAFLGAARPAPAGISDLWSRNPRSDMETLERSSRAFNQAARAAMPAVVSIRSIKMGQGTPNPLAPPEAQGGVGLGSGVVLRPDGLILTNHHVVENARSITVLFEDKDRYAAHVVGRDAHTDLALIRLDKPPANLQTIRFADSDGVEVGDWAIAIGSPFGLSHTVTSGIVSAKGRGSLGVYDIEDFIQTDAPINPGNSGGPLLNLKGEMIGLNSAIYSQTGGYMGIGFSISSNLVRKVTDELIRTGKVSRGFIGISAQDMDADLAEFFKAGKDGGALVTGIQPEGAASSTPLRVGDVIVRWNRQPVKDASDLKARVGQTPVGSEVQLEWLSEGKKNISKLTVREQPQEESNSPRQRAGSVGDSSQAAPPPKGLGLAVDDIPPELEPLVETKNGQGALVVHVVPGGAASDAGLTPGDVILRLNRTEVHTAKQFTELAHKAQGGELVVLYLQRGGAHRRIYVPLRPLAG